jgi:hypothetical protein
MKTGLSHRLFALASAPLLAFCLSACDSSGASNSGGALNSVAGSENSQATYEYDYITKGCDTGDHVFNSKDDYCRALADDSLNQGCSKERRDQELAESCGVSLPSPSPVPTASEPVSTPSPFPTAPPSATPAPLPLPSFGPGAPKPSSTCPNLAGIYVSYPDSDPYAERLYYVQQSGCDHIQFSYCNGLLQCGFEGYSYEWQGLDGSAPKARYDFTASFLAQSDKILMRLDDDMTLVQGEHIFCQYSDVSITLGTHGEMVWSYTEKNCQDGYSGPVQRIIQKNPS